MQAPQTKPAPLPWPCSMPPAPVPEPWPHRARKALCLPHWALHPAGADGRHSDLQSCPPCHRAGVHLQGEQMAQQPNDTHWSERVDGFSASGITWSKICRSHLRNPPNTRAMSRMPKAVVHGVSSTVPVACVYKCSYQGWLLKAVCF